MDFVAIDFETAKFSRESACSVGLVKYTGGQKTDWFYSLIRPPVLYIRPDFTDIHGLTVDDVRDAPVFPQIWESAMKPFIGSLPLVAHNAQFDMSVLHAVLDWYELPVPEYRYFDSLAVAQKMWPELGCHKLTFLGDHFGIEYDAHNSLADAETCAKLVFIAADELRRNGKLHASCEQDTTVEAMLDAAGCGMRKIEPYTVR
jgi:DNA polymerase-3 subunit epsilon